MDIVEAINTRKSIRAFKPDPVPRQVLEEILSLEMRYPTLSDCIRGASKQQGSDAVRTQFAIYVEAMTKCNGEELTAGWKSKFGMPMFNNLKDVKNDLYRISDEVKKYGLDTMVEKTCPSCDKVWKSNIPTVNFFVSALRSE